MDPIEHRPTGQDWQDVQKVTGAKVFLGNAPSEELEKLIFRLLSAFAQERELMKTEAQPDEELQLLIEQLLHVLQKRDRSP